MENNSLQHHGIKGMRWGIRRFQRKDGSLTSAGKKRYGDAPEETKEEYEARKQKALTSGSATDVLKFKGDLTPQEMQSAINRIRWEQDMQGLSNKEIAAGKKTADQFFNKVEKATGYANSTIKAWNTVANVVNAFGNLDVSLPKIDTNITGGNKSERKAEKKEKQKAEEAKQKRAEQEAQRETKHKERAEKKAKKEAESKSDDTVYTGKVSGKGTSSGSSKGKKAADEYVDVEWRDVEDYRSTGQSYVNQLLGLPAPKDDD